MRILYWLLGATAVAAAGAFVANRGKRRSVARDFLEALRSGPVTIHADEPHIIESGVRAEIFRGEASGRPFAFVAQIDASQTRWSFTLAWAGAGQFQESWNTLRGEADHPLQAAYAILRRHAAKTGGKPFN